MWKNIEERVDSKLAEFSTLLSDIRQALTVAGIFPSPPALTVTPPNPFGSQESLADSHTRRLSALKSEIDIVMSTPATKLFEASPPHIENVEDVIMSNDISADQSGDPHTNNNTTAQPMTPVAAISVAHLNPPLPSASTPADLTVPESEKLSASTETVDDHKPTPAQTFPAANPTTLSTNADPFPPLENLLPKTVNNDPSFSTVSGNREASDAQQLPLSPVRGSSQSVTRA